MERKRNQVIACHIQLNETLLEHRKGRKISRIILELRIEKEKRGAL